MSKKRNRHNEFGGPAAKKHESTSTIQRHPPAHKSKPSHPTNSSSTHSAPQKSLPHSAKPTTVSNTKTPNQPQNQPIIPFIPGDRVLLVGEGDFSFTLSLARHHSARIAKICATCFDSREELVEKYEQAEGYIKEILRLGEGGNMKQEDDNDGDGEGKDDDVYHTDDELSSDYDPTDHQHHQRTPKLKPQRLQTQILYSIDATKLHTSKALRQVSHARFTRIVFNFPHVGGKSTDVNRQVRYNQALLHDFFISAKELLTPKEKGRSGGKEYQGEKTGANDVPLGARRGTTNKGKKDMSAVGMKVEEEVKVDPTILVTLFEGVPYTLWNIKDLARSAGLKVLRSWAFRSEVYPGYEHARTLGNIRAKGKGVAGDGEGGSNVQEHQRDGSDAGAEDAEGGDNGEWTGFTDDDSNDDDDDNETNDANEALKDMTKTTHSNPEQKRPGRWRGEERAARTYEFGLVEDESGKTGKATHSTSDNHDDDEFARFKKKRKKKGGKLFDEDASSEDEKR